MSICFPVLICILYVSLCESGLLRRSSMGKYWLFLSDIKIFPSSIPGKGKKPGSCVTSLSFFLNICSNFLFLKQWYSNYLQIHFVYQPKNPESIMNNLHSSTTNHFSYKTGIFVIFSLCKILMICLWKKFSWFTLCIFSLCSQLFL